MSFHFDVTEIDLPPTASTTSTRKWEPTEEQLKIFKAVQHESANMLINAVAGSGKTTTILESTWFTPVDSEILFLAFNKSIELELKDRTTSIARSIEVKTVHALGLSMLRAFDRRVKVNTSLHRSYQELLRVEVLKRQQSELLPFLNTIIRLVALAKTIGLLAVQPFKADELWTQAAHYSVDLEGVTFLDEIADLVEWTLLYIKSNYHSIGINFDDMIWLPLALDLTPPHYNIVYVDEVQDLSITKQAILQALVAPQANRAPTRLIMVGDIHQAIYGFSGADASSMNTLRALFNPAEFDLTYSWRAPVAIANLARRFVPHFNHAPNAIPGKVSTIETTAFKTLIRPNDVVLCRFNSYLISAMFALIDVGRKVKFLGRDFASTLIEMIDKFGPELSMQSFFSQLHNHSLNVTAKLLDGKLTEASARTQQDYIECLTKLGRRAIGNDAYCKAKAIKSLILQHFVAETDDLSGVIQLSTIHKYKGREADNVYILGYNQLQPAAFAKQTWEQQQELNLMYVAVTRARKSLTFVDLKSRASAT